MLILVKIVTDDTSIVAENFISYFHKKFISIDKRLVNKILNSILW